jgi:hypothetical protein
MDVQYETDFVAWSEQQASLLHAHRFELEALGIDAANLVDEVEALGQSVKRDLRSRLVILLLYLLKWDYQPMRQSVSWRVTIDEQRVQIADLLQENPSLRPTLGGVLAKAYESARRYAVADTGLKPDTFPADCPWTVAQVLGM